MNRNDNVTFAGIEHEVIRRDKAAAIAKCGVMFLPRSERAWTVKHNVTRLDGTKPDAITMCKRCYFQVEHEEGAN